MTPDSPPEITRSVSAAPDSKITSDLVFLLADMSRPSVVD